MTDPALTLVTPILNRAALMAQALDSVAQQAGVAVEHIAVDGGSTDGTLELLRANPAVRLIEAPGTGLYAALDIGIRAARAPVIGQLNSDDLLPPGCLSRVLDTLARNPGADAVRGRARFFAEDAAGARRPLPVLDAEFPLHLRLEDATRGQPSINALYYRRALHERVGGFDQRFPVAADRDWLVRAFAAGIRIAVLDEPVYAYRHHGGSLTITAGTLGNEKLHEEYRAIAARHAADRTLPADVRAECRRWLAKEIGLLAALRGRRRPAAGLATVARGLAADPLWPARLLPQLGALALRRLKRRRLA